MKDLIKTSFSIKKTLVFIGCFSCLFSAKLQAYDLLDIWQASKEYSMAYSSDQHRLKADRLQAKTALASLLPTVYAERNYNFNNIFDGEHARTINDSINIQQTLFNGPAYYNYKLSKKRIAITAVQSQQTEEGLFRRVVDAYLDILEKENQLAAIKSSKVQFSRRLEQAQTTYERGLATILNVYEAQAAYEDALVKELETSNLLQTSKTTLERYTGLANIELEDIQAEAELRLAKLQDVAELKQIALANNLNLQALRLQYATSEMNVKSNQAQRWPTADLVLARTHNKRVIQLIGRYGAVKNNDHHVALRISMPIYSGRRVSNSILSAKEVSYQLQDLIVEQERQIASNVADGYRQLALLKDLIAVKHKYLATAQLRVKASELGYKVGERNFLDVLDTQRNLLTAQFEYTKSRYDYIKQYIGVLRATNQLSDYQVIAQINATLFRQQSFAN